ncbi:MAG: DMT family transporter [Kiritimatiellae bacterium]|nr:DMT family transporter [Kiritimatiellia bacterium]
MNPHAFTLVALSALTLGFYDLSRKHAVRGNSAVDVLLWSSSAGLAAFLCTGALSGSLAGAARATAAQRCLMAVKVLLVGASWGAVFLAMRTLPITLAAPVRATAPLWTLLGAVALYGETPGPVRAAGMALMVAGYVALASIGGREGFPWRGREMCLVGAGTLLGAASALYDKYLLARLGLPPRTVQLHFSAGLVLLYGSVWAVRRAIWPRGERSPFSWRWTVPLAGVLLVLSDAMYFRAVAAPGSDISLVSAFRRSSAVVAFLAGGLLFRDLDLKRKGVALLAVMAGAALAAAG